MEVLDEPPRTRDVRDTNRATVQVTVVNERVLAFCAIDNLWKGAAGQAVQDLNLMLGLPETEGLRVSGLLPVALGRGARARDRARADALPAGFRAAGVAAGLKPEGLDVGVLVSDAARHGLRRAVHHQRAAWARR